MLDYQRAQKLYRSGQDLKAVKILQKIIKKYPDHFPSHILLGEIAYDYGKINLAQKHFQKVPMEMISADIAYEYGITMFVGGNCKKAHVGFSRVQPSDRAYSLAIFYRGVCFLREQKSHKAVAYLKRATKLPPRLQQSRNDALKEALRRMKLEQISRYQQANPYSRTQTPVYTAVEYAKKARSQEDPKKASPKKIVEVPPNPVIPPMGFEQTLLPSFLLSQTSRTQDYFGNRVNEATTTSTESELRYNARYQFSPDSTGRQSFLQVPVTLRHLIEGSEGGDTSYITYTDEPGTVIEQEANRTSESRRELELAVSVEGGVPLMSSVTLFGGYRRAQLYPNIEIKDKSASVTPNIRLSLAFDHLTFDLTGNQKDVLNSSDQILRMDQTIGGKFSANFDAVDLSIAAQQTDIAPGPATSSKPELRPKQLQTQQGEAIMTKSWESFNMSFGFFFWQQALAPGIVANPGRPEMSSLKLSFSANWTWDYGLSYHMMFAQTKKYSFRQTFDIKGSNPPNPDAPAPQKLIQAEATDQEVSASAKLAPVDWAFGQIALAYQIRGFSLDDPSYQKEFEEANYETGSEFSLSFGVSKSF